MAQDFDAERAAAAIREPEMAVGEGAEEPLRELAPCAIDAPEGSVAQQAAEFLSGSGRTQQVRRRVLNAQLARLALRVGDTGLAARDAAARTVRLTARLERNELGW